VFTYLGVTERSRSGGTVYATLVALDPRRGLVGAHRKLMPTHEERLVWGTGDGHGLRTHPVNGIRVGGLNCWENWMPLARHALYAQGLDLHVAVWPGSVSNTRDITRFIAMEGRCYVLSVAGLLREDDIAPGFPLLDKLSGDRSWWREGGSAIAGPDGEWLVEPTPGVEGLITAEIDPALVRGARQNFDPAGHYGRPDVLRLEVGRRRLEGATFVDGG
jgi:nitrilase